MSLLAVAGLAAVIGGCAPAATTTAPSPAAPSAAEPSPSDAVGGSDGPTTAPSTPASDAPATTQTDTAWGRIWDDLPAGFPVFPTATIADDATAEPISGVFAIPDGDPAEVAAWMQAALETATYSTEALSGPFEDGSVTLDSVGDGDCRIQTVVTPMGGLTLMTIRYGAACPNR
jgi:hypothetical protein